MSSRFKGKLCLHLRAKELTIFRDSFIWQLAAWAWAWAGVAGRWARRHAAPAVVGRFIFFRDLAFFGDSEDSGFGDTDGRTTTDGRNRAHPRPPFLEQKIAKILSPKFFLAILKWKTCHFLPIPLFSGREASSSTWLLLRQGYLPPLLS